MAVIYNNNPQKASAIYGGITTLLCMFTYASGDCLYIKYGGKSWKSAVTI